MILKYEGYFDKLIKKSIKVPQTHNKIWEKQITDKPYV